MSTATGTASVTLNAAETQITWVVTHNVTGATAGHIHNAPAFANGGVAIGFTSPTSPITGSATISLSQVTELKAGRLYVNIHSGTFPSGEIRGQLLRPGEQLFRTNLSGANEVPPNTSTGTGGMQVILGGSMVNCYGTYSGLTGAPTASHIHRGAAGANGPVVIPLTLAANNTITCTNVTVTPGDAADLATAMWYVNVHTGMFGGGEVRGQLTAP
jgi:hypothetical protein